MPSTSRATPRRPSVAQHRVDRRRACAAREVRRPVAVVALAVVALQVARVDGDRREVRLGIADEHDPAVVRDVQRLVAVGRPRVGLVDAGDERRAGARSRRPQPERAVDVHPRVVAVRQVADRAEVLERARVHVAGLRRDDRRRRPGSRASSRSSSSRDDAPLVVAGHRPQAARARSRAAARRASIVTWRSSGTTTRTGGAPCSPRSSTSQPWRSSTDVARDGEAGHVRHLAAGA